MLRRTMSQQTYKNLVGPKIRALRHNHSWTQEMLATALCEMGWNISRSTLAKIEARLVYVSDSDLLYFVSLFDVEPLALFPRVNPKARLGMAVRCLLTRERTGIINRSKSDCDRSRGNVAFRTPNKQRKRAVAHRLSCITP